MASRQGGLLASLGLSSQNASILARLGTAGIIRELTRAADEHVAKTGGAPWTPSVKRAKRQAAAAVRRGASRSGMLRSIGRGIADNNKPTAADRRAMRRQSYLAQADTIDDDRLLAIPPEDLPPELAERRRELEKASPAAAPAGAASPPAEDATRRKIDQQLRDIIGDPDKLPPHVRAQLEQQIADKFGQPAAENPTSAPEEGGSAQASTSNPTPQPTSSQRATDGIRTVVDAQLAGARQPARQGKEGGSTLDSLQTGLDAVGVADPTPIADGTNAVISLGRAAADPKRRSEHLQNAAISAVSAVVPYVGDTAKLIKVGRAARKTKTAARTAEGAVDAGAAAKGAAHAGPPVGPAARFGGGGSGGGSQPPQFGGPTPPSPGGPGSGGGPSRRRQAAQGVAAHDDWVTSLKNGAVSMASFAGKVYLAIEGLKLLNTGVLALNRELAPYSGTLAGSYAKADNADIRRDMKRAQRLAKPLSHLQEQQTKLQDTMAELAAPIQGILIEILAKLTMLAEIGTSTALHASKLDWLVAIYDFFVRKDAESAPGGRQLLQDLSDGKFDGFGLDELGKRFELLDKATRENFGIGGATPRPPGRGKAP